MRKNIRLIFCGIFGFVAVFFSGCNVINKQEEIPGYLYIDSVSIASTSAQGNNIHDIGVIQVYIANEFLGNFELPARIPVLKKGIQPISILAGVRENGASSTFRYYNVLSSFDTTLTIAENTSTQLRHIVFKYRNNTAIKWQEDFEDNNTSLVSSEYPDGDTFYIANEPYSLRGRFNGLSKALVLDLKDADTSKYIEFKSFQKFTGLPVDGTNVYFEFDMKSNFDIQVGIIRYINGTPEAIPYLIILDTQNEWKRFYLNLNYELGGQPNGVEIELFMAANIFPDESAGRVLIDNIKLLHLN